MFKKQWVILCCFMTPLIHADEALFYPEVKRLCLTNLPTSRPQCDALIERLERQNNVPELLRLTTAYINLRFKANDENLRNSLKNKITATVDRIMLLEPDNTQGLLASSIFSSKEEKIRIYQRILAVDPAHFAAMNFISTILLAGDQDEREQGIQVLMKGYPLTKGDRRWVLAVKLYQVLSVEKDGQRAAELRKKVFEDMSIDVNQETYKVAIDQLHLVCRNFVIEFDGENICLKSIRLVANDGLKQLDRLKQDSAKLIPALTTLLFHKHKLQQRFVDVQIELRDLFEDIKLTGKQPPQFYLAYAQLLSGERRIAALRKAANDGKQPGQAIYWLAEALRKVGRYSEAIDLFKQLVEHGVAPYSNIAEAVLPAISQLQQTNQNRGAQ